MRGIDRFGSLARNTDARLIAVLNMNMLPERTLVDLTTIGVPVVPSVTVDGIHEWRDVRGKLRSTPYGHELTGYDSLASVQARLSSEGLHRLMVCLKMPDMYYLVVRTFRPPSPEYFRTTLRPAHWETWLEPDYDPKMYPHACPICGQAAYIGLNTIECTGDACRK